METDTSMSSRFYVLHRMGHGREKWQAQEDTEECRERYALTFPVSFLKYYSSFPTRTACCIKAAKAAEANSSRWPSDCS